MQSHETAIKPENDYILHKPAKWIFVQNKWLRYVNTATPIINNIGINFCKVLRSTVYKPCTNARTYWVIDVRSRSLFRINFIASNKSVQ